MGEEVMRRVGRRILVCLAVVAVSASLRPFCGAQDPPVRPAAQPLDEGPQPRESAEPRSPPSPQRDLHVRSSDSPIRVISEEVPRWKVGSAPDGPPGEGH